MSCLYRYLPSFALVCNGVWQTLILVAACRCRCQLNDLQINGATPLHAAAVNGKPECVRVLLEQPGIDINSAAPQGRSAFFLCCHYGRIESLKLLLADERTDLNQVDSEGMTPLLAAILQSQVEAVRLLLEDASGRVDTRAVLIDGQGPMFMAARGASPAVISLLHEHGVVADGEEQLHHHVTPGRAVLVSGIVTPFLLCVTHQGFDAEVLQCARLMLYYGWVSRSSKDTVRKLCRDPNRRVKVHRGRRSELQGSGDTLDPARLRQFLQLVDTPVYRLVCGLCHAPEPTHKCPCKLVSYCGAECHRRNWSKHKLVCPRRKNK